MKSNVTTLRLRPSRGKPVAAKNALKKRIAISAYKSGRMPVFRQKQGRFAVFCRFRARTG
jgi:hypothetical protein